MGAYLRGGRLFEGALESGCLFEGCAYSRGALNLDITAIGYVQHLNMHLNFHHVE